MIPVRVTCHVCHEGSIETEVGPDVWDETAVTCPSCEWPLVVGVVASVHIDPTRPVPGEQP